MTATKTIRQIYNSQGQCSTLGLQIGNGGEGAVFEVNDYPERVVKIYHNSVSAEKAAKLQHMAALTTDRLLKLAAWPLGTVHASCGGPVVGFLMPKVVGYQQIHTLYSPKSRLAEFPDSNWKFLLHTARNLAQAFSVIHEHGHVVGDVNHGNVVVAPTGIVRLIDCDSFQIMSDSKTYLCEVGVSTHTPPELQDKPFRGIVRTSDHDAFGLAVLIFQLLFMGRHPFSGYYL